MTKLLRISFLLVLMSYISMTFPNISAATITLPWASNFSTCDDWIEAGAGPTQPTNCPGVQAYGAFYCNTNGANQGEQINSGAANPACGDTKGVRHWMGDGTQTTRSNSGGTWVTFATPQTELYIRFYARWTAGFTYSPVRYQKIIYMNVTQNNFMEVDWPYGSDGANLYPNISQNYAGMVNSVTGQAVSPNGTNNINVTSGVGWQTIMNGTGDGKWHQFEYHFRMETSGNYNGLYELWIDGVKKISINGVRFGGGAWNWILFGSNAEDSANGACTAIDYNDLSISTTGPIGLCGGVSGGASNVPPNPPSGLH